MPDLEAQLRRYGAILDGAEPALTDVADAPIRPALRSLIVAVAAFVVVAIATSAIAITATRSGDDHRPNVITPSSARPNPTPTSNPTPAAKSRRVLAIGDSVMEGASGSLQRAMPEIAVDAIRSRQFSQAQKVLGLYASANLLPNTVVIALGTNGRATDSGLDDLMRAAGDREVFFVTVRVPRLWESEVNAALRELPQRWPNAHVIDWHEFANGHDDWFLPDGFHLTIAGQDAYATLIASTLGLLPKPTPNTPSGLNVVALEQGQLPPVPLAVAGGDVWIAQTDYAQTPPVVHLQRRDPKTTKLLASIEVHQEAVYAIAGDGDTLWVAGGGDGGVPETTVSRVDARTGSVVFTKTLTGTPCACPIVAGSAGVWLTGGGTDVALRLSPTDGHVLATVTLPKVTRAVMETSSRLLVGLDDGSVAVVDPQTNRIERFLEGTAGTPSTAPVTAMAGAPVWTDGSKPAIDGYVVHADGKTFALFSGNGQLREFLTMPFVATAVADVGGLMWAFGGDRLQMQPIVERPQELAYDSDRHEFVKVPQSPATQLQGFRNAVVVGDRLWVVYDDGVGRHFPSVVVIEAPVVREG